MPDLPLEQRARKKIDAMLRASGWVIQAGKTINLCASRGVAICELTFATGDPEYTHFVDGKAIGTVEAKPQGDSARSLSRLPYSTAHGLTRRPPVRASPFRFAEFFSLVPDSLESKESYENATSANSLYEPDA